MSFLTGLVIGSLGGGLIIWMLNRLHRRRRYAAEPAPLREAVKQLDESLDTTRTDNEPFQNELMITTSRSQRYEAEIEMLHARLATANREREQLQGELAAARLVQQPQAPVGKQAASQTGACFQSATGDPGTSNGAACTVEPQPETGLAATGRIHIGTIFDRDRLMIMPESFSVVPSKPQATQRNPLSDINGIGPIYAQKLFDAGIRTLRDLAALSPERVRAIIDPRPWRTIDVERWIMEARQQTRPA
jgi:hypothetical protein